MKLIDAVQQNVLHPATFKVPTPEEKAALAVGDFVKLGFVNEGARLGEPAAERMWVLITGKNEGILDNDPVVLKRLHWGDRVKFRPENILAISRGMQP